MTNKTNKNYFILIVCLLSLLFLTGYAEPPETNENNGITLTWQDLQDLLDLKSDKIKVTWAEFQKLLAQTGTHIDMDFQLQGGIVTIERDRFRQILNKMKPYIKKMPTPPRVRPEMPVLDTNPRIAASPWSWVSRSTSPRMQPACA